MKPVANHITTSLYRSLWSPNCQTRFQSGERAKTSEVIISSLSTRAQRCRPERIPAGAWQEQLERLKRLRQDAQAQGVAQVDSMNFTLPASPDGPGPQAASSAHVRVQGEPRSGLPRGVSAGEPAGDGQAERPGPVLGSVLALAQLRALQAEAIALIGA
jgi:hypothetical protein